MKLITSKSPAGIVPCTDKRENLEIMGKGEFVGFGKYLIAPKKGNLLLMSFLREISPLTLQTFYRRFLPFYRPVCVCVYVCVCIKIPSPPKSPSSPPRGI